VVSLISEGTRYTMSTIVNQVVDPNDPWALATGQGYSVDTFYVRSTDGKGHSENIQAKLSPAMVGELNALIRTGDVPYRTIQDFIRDACTHRAKWLADNKLAARSLDPIAAADALLAIMEQRKLRRELAENMAAQTKREFDEAMRHGDTSEALQMIDYLDQVADTWQDVTQQGILLESVEKMRNEMRNEMVRRSRARA
jgi:hypothetical protein